MNLGELKLSVDENQINLKKAIIVHQAIRHKALQDLENEEIKKKLAAAEQNILKLGLEQKLLLRKLRAELSILEEKTQQLTSKLVRSREHKIAPESTSSCSDDSNEESFESPSPELSNSKSPELLAQIDFLGYFCLTTPEQSKEMQKMLKMQKMQQKRVKRKRKSTANKDFIYETDLPPKKRKKSSGDTSTISPPNKIKSVENKIVEVLQNLRNKFSKKKNFGIDTRDDAFQQRAKL